MGSISILHWLIVLVVIGIWVIPAVKILNKAGYSGWWCLLLFVPVVDIVFIWVFAFARWPILANVSPATRIT
jgi:uncharacterized membrane protein YhaH (DUF805 family)